MAYIKPITTYAKEGKNYYVVDIYPEEKGQYQYKRPSFKFTRKLEKSEYAYYFAITWNNYQEWRNNQRRELHKNTLDKVYWLKDLTAADIRLEDLLEEAEQKSNNESTKFNQVYDEILSTM